MDRWKTRTLKHLGYLTIIFTLITVVPNETEAKAGLSEYLQLSNIKVVVQRHPKDIPLRLVIPSANINLRVDKSVIRGGTWEISKTAASFGEGSSFLDENLGNSIIFAHARNGLFAPLRYVSTGDVVVIFGIDNVYTYKITEIEKILPNEIDRVKSIGDTNLSLFTCDGGYDQYRLLVRAKRVDVSSYGSGEVI